MPFPLPDLKRSYGRSGASGGPPDVRPYLLAGRELAAQRQRLQGVIDWHETQCGRRRAESDIDHLAQLAGDYRLARCLAACLAATYRYEPDSFEATVLGNGHDSHAHALPQGHENSLPEGVGTRLPASSGEGRGRWSRLQELGIHGPGDLRLHVYDAIGASHGGFVAPAERASALAGPAGDLRLSPEHLDTLLWIDAEANQRLRRVGAPPSPEALAGAYNRRALATLLVRALSADLVLPAPDGGAIKRLYFQVKRHGLLCDLQLADPHGGAGGDVHVHLFGPLEVFGPRTRHGDRFAGVLLRLLRMFPGLRGAARVLLNEREYHLHLGPEVATAIEGEPLIPLTPPGAGPRRGAPSPASPTRGEGNAAEADGVLPFSPTWEKWPGEEGDQPTTAVVARPNAGETFDSDVEARLFATLQGMERRRDTGGWRVEREPEPVIHNATVMVPDFALSRAGGRGEPPVRVYVEVIGFWTPAYRERKRDKLRQIAGHVPLALAVQEQLRDSFDDLPFPVLTYKHRVSAVDLIRLLNRQFVRSEAHLAAIREDLDALLEALDPSLGLVGERELRCALDLPPEESLAEALAAGSTSENGAAPGAAYGWRWIAGIGTCHESWLDDLATRCAPAITRAGGEAPLETVREAIRASALPNAARAAEHLEALLPP
ncbi:MAG: DUF790 family protein, partial [Chloroflexota bacterium]